MNRQKHRHLGLAGESWGIFCLFFEKNARYWEYIVLPSDLTWTCASNLGVPLLPVALTMLTALAYTTRSASSRLPDNVGGRQPSGGKQVWTDDIKKATSTKTNRLAILEKDEVLVNGSCEPNKQYCEHCKLLQHDCCVFSLASIDSSLVSTDSSPVSTDSSLLAFLLLEPSPYNPNVNAH